MMWTNSHENSQFRRAWRWLADVKQYSIADEKPPSRWQMAGEILVLLAAALFVTASFITSPNNHRIPGNELEWLTGGITFAHETLLREGNIPLWNPYYRTGEPTLDSAFTFLTNPLSSLPGLLLGAPQGLKLTIPINAFLVALGGWYLGYVLGFAGFARVFLGMLLLGKGNFHAMMMGGYFQLALQQVYFPWIIAGTLQTLRTRQRTPIFLTGIMMALMFMAGNIWYILPMGISTFALTVIYMFSRDNLTPLPPLLVERGSQTPLAREDQGVTGRSTLRPYNAFFRRVNFAGWKRMALAAGVMLTFSAVYTLPVVLQYDHLGGHPNEVEAGWVIEDRWQGMTLYFNEDVAAAAWDLKVYTPKYKVYNEGTAFFYYSFVAPAWLVLLIFVIIPPIYPWLHRPAQRDHRRIWTVGLLMIGLMTVWGVGGTEPFKWLYAHVPLLGGWRFVGRALAVGSFWVAVLVAMRVDGLYRALRCLPVRAIRLTGILFLAAACAVAAMQVNRQWFMFAQTVEEETYVDTCLTRLRELYPERDFSMWIFGYDRIDPFLQQRIRNADIAAEFLPLPEPNTIGHPDIFIWREMPPYALPRYPEEAGQLILRDYTVLEDTPVVDNQPCFYYNPAHDLPYAFVLSPALLSQQLPISSIQPMAQPALAYRRLSDTIGVAVAGTRAEQLLLVQENAYPGWQVTINGQPAKLEVGGGLMGVLLPAAPGEVMEVIFAYRPPLVYLGGGITILSAVVCILCLLRVDRWIYRR